MKIEDLPVASNWDFNLENFSEPEACKTYFLEQLEQISEHFPSLMSLLGSPKGGW